MVNSDNRSNYYGVFRGRHHSMGKCLSCFKSDRMSRVRVNDSSNRLNNCISDKCKISVSRNQNRSCSILTSSEGGLNRSEIADNLAISSKDNYDDIVIHGRSKSSPSANLRQRHFPPFFGGNAKSHAEDKLAHHTGSFEVKLNALFDKYKDTDDENVMLINGVERLCTDLNLRPDDVKILIFAWQLNADQMYQFSRQEFVDGCKTLQADSIPLLRSRLCDLCIQLKNDAQQFRNLYKFTFKFGLDRMIGQRILPIDMALCLWRVVFSLNKPPILDRWLLFLENDKTQVRGIPRDTWNMFLNFSETIGDDLSAYNDAEAWPSIFDDFVEFENDRLNQNVTPYLTEKNEIS